MKPNTYRLWTDEEREYIVSTIATKSVAEQAAHLNRTYKAVADLRKRLARAGRIDVRMRRSKRPWTMNERDTVTEMIAAGHSVATIAKKLKRSQNAIYRYLVKNGGINQKRAGLWSVRSTRGVAELFGVSETTVRHWSIRDWLFVRRNVINRRSKYQQMGIARLITDEALLKFMSVRAAWPTWEPEKITDPDWRAAAIEIRQAARGRWMPMADAARLVNYSPQHLLRIMKAGGWPVEAVLVRTSWYIWLADGARLPVPQRKESAA